MPEARATTDTLPIEIGLSAAIVTVTDLAPQILVVADPAGNRQRPASLPFGPFNPVAHHTIEEGLRAWVNEQTALRLGYVEQLYTFGDRGRHAMPGDDEAHVVSVGYLALTRANRESSLALASAGAAWRPWYGYFPWEDWRDGRPDLLDELELAFGEGGLNWDEERILDRYELMYEAGMVLEAQRDRRHLVPTREQLPPLGTAMRFDHRRILATAISRLRAKLKYRPVVFELMAPEFTLTELQLTVEAISGRHFHKQNFRRLVEGTALVEPTGDTATGTGGRPAALFRFRRDVLRERPAPGLRVGGR
jgi:hypothetical protein